MAPRKKSKANPRPQKRRLPTTSPASPFVSFSINGESLKKFGKTDKQLDQELEAKQARLDSSRIAASLAQGQAPTPQSLPETEPEDPEMRTRGAWDKNKANPKRTVLPAPPPPPRDVVSSSPAARTAAANRQATPRDAGPKARVQKSTAAAGTQNKRRKSKHVAFDEDAEIFETRDAGIEESSPEPESGTDKENEYTYTSYTFEADDDVEMADDGKPKLKLRMSSMAPAGATPALQPVSTPAPQSATQRIKLNFGPSRKPSIIGSAEAPVIEEGSPGAESASKKRKRDSVLTNADDEGRIPRPGMGPRKITLKTKVPLAQTPHSAVTPHVKFSVKGRTPTRKKGVGYDSENDDREDDPVIIEGFILRMQPGSDCDYIQDAISKGTMGISKVQGGADVGIKLYDTHGRRGMLTVKGNKYATTLVDLPCIIEGIKSWDKRGFIKSLDICQMLLVLGPCRSDDEARNYRLPEDVNAGNYQYAHGVTPPMKWVRKRRFARTRRQRVDDIEAVERRVAQLLADDSKANSSTFEVLDYDPRDEAESEEAEEELYSGTEGEEDAEGEAEDYFGNQNGHGGTVESPMYETPTGLNEVDDEDVDEFTRMLEGGGDETTGVEHQQPGHLQPPEDSSFAVTSTSASPSASANITGAQTPASVGATSDEDDDDDGDDEEKSESGKEDDENLQQTKDRIKELEEKIKEQKETLKRQQNGILRRKIATKIGELEKDVGMLRRGIGLGDDEEGDGE